MESTYAENKKNHIITITVICISLIICLISDGFSAAEDVRSDCLRLHILAYSDSPEDQRVKLLVRDALFCEGAEIFDGSKNADEACEKIIENAAFLEETANRVLAENGFSYKASISVEKEYFDTRQYDSVTLPAGEYTACKVILGEGDGQNWWCVMFPPMCLPVAENNDDIYAVFGDNGASLVTQKNGYKIKFRLVELFEEVINYIREK